MLTRYQVKKIVAGLNRNHPGRNTLNYKSNPTTSQVLDECAHEYAHILAFAGNKSNLIKPMHISDLQDTVHGMTVTVHHKAQNRNEILAHAITYVAFSGWLPGHSLKKYHIEACRYAIMMNNNYIVPRNMNSDEDVTDLIMREVGRPRVRRLGLKLREILSSYL